MQLLQLLQIPRPQAHPNQKTSFGTDYLCTGYRVDMLATLPFTVPSDLCTVYNLKNSQKRGAATIWTSLISEEKSNWNFFFCNVVNQKSLQTSCVTFESFQMSCVLCWFCLQRVLWLSFLLKSAHFILCSVALSHRKMLRLRLFWPSSLIGQEPSDESCSNTETIDKITPRHRPSLLTQTYGHYHGELWELFMQQSQMTTEIHRFCRFLLTGKQPV